MIRRHFLGALAGGVACLALPKAGLGQTLLVDRKFLFVHLPGGWDPLAFSAPLFDSPYVDMEDGAQRYTVGGLSLVGHANRPAVNRFFERWGPQTALVNGVSTRSVAHEVCSVIATTGDASGGSADWPTLIAQNAQVEYSLPSLVVGGFSYPGNLESLVCRVGDAGQLQSLVENSLAEEIAAAEPDFSGLEGVMDRFLSRRLARSRDSRLGRRSPWLLSDFSASDARARELKALGELAPLAQDGFQEQINTAVTALALGLSRCITITDQGDWDTHEDNAEQAPLLNALFSGLGQLMESLQSTTAQSGSSLSEETTVVVLSEMGRTPKYNATGGRDHWPYTSALILGAGVEGGRQVGAFDDKFTGIGIDPETGLLEPGRLGVSSADLGATLLRLADVDSRAHLPYAQPIRAVLRS